MSTTTVSVRSTTRESRIEDVRRREAEAREAARRAAERAARYEEQQRRRAEAREVARLEAERQREIEEQERARRRMEAAKRNIADQETRFQRCVARLDEASRRLPDLALRAPNLSGLQGRDAADPDVLEDYARQLALEVSNFSGRLDAAISQAELVLRRRVATAAAWRAASDLEHQVALLIQSANEIALGLQTQVGFPAMPGKPDANAELEAVESYVQVLKQVRDSAAEQHANLQARLDARDRAAALAGERVDTVSAEAAHARYESDRRAAAQVLLRATMDGAFAASGMELADVPESLQALLADALSQAHVQDRSAQVTRWIAREKQRRDGVERAFSMMQNAPDLVHEDEALSRRWESLVASLQRVASGLESFTTSLDHEYAQLRGDCLRNLNTAYTKADWRQALSDQGFERLEKEDGSGVIVVDLDHPETWLEVKELELEQGGFGAVLELKTDAQSSAEQEAAVTSDICSRLAKVAGATTPGVQTQAEVIEQKKRITRGRRPAVARKAFAKGL